MKLKRKDRSKRKFRSLNGKAIRSILLVSVILIVVGSIVGVGLHTYSSLCAYKREGDHLMDYAIALEDSDYIEHLMAEGKKIFAKIPDDLRKDPISEEYQAYFAPLVDDDYLAAKKILTTCYEQVGQQNLWFIFIDPKSDGWVYMLDADPTEYTYQPGFCLFSDWKQIEKICDSKWRMEIAQFDKDGYVAADYKRLYSKDGEVIGYVEMDLDLTKFAKQLNHFLMWLILAVILLAVLIGWLTSRLIRKQFINQIAKLTSAAREYTARDNTEITEQTPSIFEPLEMNTRDEFETLWTDMTNMEADVKSSLLQVREMTAEQERINAELGIATEIQLGMLPESMPENQSFKLSGLMLPAREVGGDLYDYFMIDDHHLALVIADVSGKGVSAALFMMVAKTLINNQTEQGVQDPADICDHVNRKLFEVNKAKLFVTAWIGIVDLDTGEIRYVDAGHEYPAVCRGGEFTLTKDMKCVPLAASKKLKYRSGSISLEPGDSVFLYTDGVSEANNSEGELFGRERMLACLNNDPSADPETVIKNMTEAIASFVRGAPQFDDTTMLCFRYLGAHPKEED